MKIKKIDNLSETKSIDHIAQRPAKGHGKTSI